MENKNSPKFRFKGYNEDWQLKPLGNLFEITSASRVLKNEWTNVGVPFFRSSDVVSAYKGTDNSKAFISFELYNKLSSISGCVQKNDLLVTGGGSIGIPYLVKTNEPLYFKDADLLWLKSANKVSGYFLYTFFSTTVFRNYVNSITHIGTISHYTIEQAKVTPIIIPNQTEQNQIGTFFENLDKLLTEHQQKHSKLKALKKAMLAKMFPQQGQTVPEIRFKGFSGDWEEKMLNEFSTYHSSTLSVGNALSNGKYKLYDANDVIGYSNENGQPCDYITIIKDGSGVGRIRLLSKNTSFIATMGAIRAFGSDINFLFCCLLNTDFSKYISGATIPHIYYSSYGEKKYYIPSEAEQQKIGNYFKNIDDLIDNHGIQIEKLQNIKKAFLAKMFI